MNEFGSFLECIFKQFWKYSTQYYFDRYTSILYTAVRCATLPDDCQSWNLKLVLGHSTVLVVTCFKQSWHFWFPWCLICEILKLYWWNQVWSQSDCQISSATNRWILQLNDRPFRQLLIPLHNLRKAASYQPHQVCLGKNGCDLSRVGLQTTYWCLTYLQNIS